MVKKLILLTIIIFSFSFSAVETFQYDKNLYTGQVIINDGIKYAHAIVIISNKNKPIEEAKVKFLNSFPQIVTSQRDKTKSLLVERYLLDNGAGAIALKNKEELSHETNFFIGLIVDNAMFLDVNLAIIALEKSIMEIKKSGKPKFKISGFTEKVYNEL